MLLFNNNKILIQLFKEVSNISKIKQIYTNFYQIIEKFKNRSIKLFWVFSEKMLANSFIKPLSQPVFEDKQVHIKVVDIKKNS